MTAQLIDADLHAPIIDAVMSASLWSLGVEAVYIDDLTDKDSNMLRVVGAIPGVVEGMLIPPQRSLCHHMIDGAPPFTTSAREIPAYAQCQLVQDCGVTSYIGVPIHNGEGVIGTLCGIDRASVELSDSSLRGMSGLAGVVEAHLVESNGGGPALRRSPDGWRVGHSKELDLTSAMSLADLIAAELTTPARPPRPDTGSLSETDRLRLSVQQLEHALAARVTVEQAIGVLAERQHVNPRTAFERLRKAARTRGRKVHDLAQEVVASATDTSVPLPPEVAGRR